MNGNPGQRSLAATADTLDDLVANGARRIAGALGLQAREARLEVQVLAAHALGVNRAWLVAHGRDLADSARVNAVEALLARRAAGEPVAYIVGEREFYGRPFRVTPDVLIPRPETELLVEAALERLPTDRPARVLDLGTGSGCIAITLALAGGSAAVSAADLSEAALQVARGNAAALGANVEWRLSDLFSAFEGRQFDMIVSNPPYIAAHDMHLERGDLRFEPRQALGAGPDGLEVIRRLLDEAPKYLVGGGWLLFEHGWDQAVPAWEIMSSRDFLAICQLEDMQGHRRVTVGQRA